MDPSWKSLTVRQILSHTSGIDQMLTAMAVFTPEEYKKVGASYEGIKFMLSKPRVIVDPDEAPAYENMNYAMDHPEAVGPDRAAPRRAARDGPERLGSLDAGVHQRASVRPGGYRTRVVHRGEP